MAYQRPIVPDFNPTLWATNKTLKAEQIRDGMLSLFVAGYEDFWGVENGTSRHTVAEMQSIIDNMPAALDILTDAVKFTTFANQAFPGQLAERYHTGVFAVTVAANGAITVGELNPAWVPAPPETPAPETPAPEEGP